MLARGAVLCRRFERTAALAGWVHRRHGERALRHDRHPRPGAEAFERAGHRVVEVRCEGQQRTRQRMFVEALRMEMDLGPGEHAPEHLGLPAVEFGYARTAGQV